MIPRGLESPAWRGLDAHLVMVAKVSLGFFDMVPIWNSRIACNDGGGIVCSLWAFSADFRVL